MPVPRRRLLEAVGTAGTVLVSPGCLADGETTVTDTPAATPSAGTATTGGS